MSDKKVSLIKNIILSACYIAIAELVYIWLALEFGKQWYFGLLAGVVVLIIGGTIGFFFVKSEYDKQNKEEIKPQEAAAPTEEVEEAQTEENK